MAVSPLSEFLNQLADASELTRVRTEVNRRFELAAIVQRAVHETGGPALLFENVAGSGIPVVAGLLGTERRMRLALRTASLDDVADRITALLRPDLPDSLVEALRLLPRFAEVLHWPPVSTATALSQQVVHLGSDVDLGTLPVPVYWPGETLPALTAAQLLIDVAGRRVVSRVPVQIRDRNTVLIHWTPHDESWNAVQEAVAAGRQFPVAMALGGDPVLTLAASSPLPPYVDRLTFAGFLGQRNVAVAAARSIELQIPADAEFILECLVNPGAAFADAPSVATATGFLSGTQTVVLATVTALTHRANPVLPVIVPGAVAVLKSGPLSGSKVASGTVTGTETSAESAADSSSASASRRRFPGGLPGSEEGVLSLAIERLLLPLVRLAIPELADLRLPACGAFRNIAFASFRKTFPQQARRVMNALWGLGRLSTVKLLVVVDADVDVQNEEAVWFAVGAHAHPGRDTIFSEGPADMLDHAAPVRGVGHRVGIDATRKSAAEGHAREWPAELHINDETARLLSQRWQQYGIRPPGDSTR